MGDLVPARQRSKYQALTGMVATIALIAAITRIWGKLRAAGG